jgi:hypothetical protein
VGGRALEHRARIVIVELVMLSHSMRLLKPALIFMAFFSSFLSFLRADGYKEPLSGIEFPEVSGIYQRMDVKPYEAQPGKSGVMIDYHSQDAEVTVYVRNSASGDYKTSEDFLVDSLGAIKTLEERGTYANVKVYEFSADKERPGWKTGAFTARSENGFIMSFIYCKVVPGYYVKIRATTVNSKNDSLQPFIQTLQELVDRAPKKP